MASGGERWWQRQASERAGGVRVDATWKKGGAIRTEAICNNLQFEWAPRGVIAVSGRCRTVSFANRVVCLPPSSENFVVWRRAWSARARRLSQCRPRLHPPHRTRTPSSSLPVSRTSLRPASQSSCPGSASACCCVENKAVRPANKATDWPQLAEGCVA